MVAHLSLNVTLAMAGVPLASRPFGWTLVLATASFVAAARLGSWPADDAPQPLQPMTGADTKKLIRTS